MYYCHSDFSKINKSNHRTSFCSRTWFSFDRAQQPYDVWALGLNNMFNLAPQYAYLFFVKPQFSLPSTLRLTGPHTTFRPIFENRFNASIFKIIILFHGHHAMHISRPDCDLYDWTVELFIVLSCSCRPIHIQFCQKFYLSVVSCKMANVFAVRVNSAIVVETPAYITRQRIFRPNDKCRIVSGAELQYQQPMRRRFYEEEIEIDERSKTIVTADWRRC